MSDEDVWAAPAEREGDAPIVGLDFGSSNSCLSIWDTAQSRPVTVRNTDGAKITPSNVTFTGPSFSTNVKVGLSDSAVCINTIFGIKSYLAEGVASTLPATTTGKLPPVKGAKGVLCVSAGGLRTVMHPEEVAAHIMRYLKDCAQVFINRRRLEQRLPAVTLQRVVIGIPVTCSERQKAATRFAAGLAGFTEVHFMVESSAAALAYGLLVVGQKTVLVFDMGGGTLDITIMGIAAGLCRTLATAGHPKCGGFAIDLLLAEYIVRKLDKRRDLNFDQKYHLHRQTDIGGSLRVRLRALCRAAKECLSDISLTSVIIEISSAFFLPPKLEVLNGGSADFSLRKSDPLREERARASSSEPNITNRPDLGHEVVMSGRSIHQSVSHHKDDKIDDLPSEDEGEGVWHWAVERQASGIGGTFLVPMGEELDAPLVSQSSPSQMRHVKVTDNVIAENELDGQCPLISVELTREELNVVIEPVLNQVRHTVLTALSRWRKDIGHQAGVKNGTENHANAADTGVWRPLIDEIILVGGSSRVLSVRDALRNAVAGEPEGSEFVAQSQAPLSKASGTMINSQFDREFCASVDPNQAVSQGLAIRGAILMGVDQSLLKDVLMMDMLSTSIGLKCFKHGAPVTAEVQSADDDVIYETVLLRGVRLPTVNFKRFQLASPTQKLVTVEAFEQLEIAPEGGASSVLTWQYMGRFTCVVPRSCRGKKCICGGFVNIFFSMSEFGALSVEVAPADTDFVDSGLSDGDKSIKSGSESESSTRAGAIKEEDIDEDSEKAVWFLIGVLIILAVFYLIVKLFILDKPFFDNDDNIRNGDYERSHDKEEEGFLEDSRTEF